MLEIKNLCFSEKTVPFFVENIGIWRMIYTWTGKKRPKVRTFRRFFYKWETKSRTIRAVMPQMGCLSQNHTGTSTVPRAQR